MAAEAALPEQHDEKDDVRQGHTPQHPDAASFAPACEVQLTRMNHPVIGRVVRLWAYALLAVRVAQGK
jgi:hypothetical protein